VYEKKLDIQMLVLNRKKKNSHHVLKFWINGDINFF